MATARNYRFLVLSAGLVFAAAYTLGIVKQTEPFYTYFYLFAWACFLTAIAGAIGARRGHLPFDSWKELLWLAFFSTTLWLFFEALNLRLRNWFYLGVPEARTVRWLGYTLSFATVAPGVLWLTDLLLSFLRYRAPVVPEDRPDLLVPIWVALGIAMAALSLFWPSWFFPLIWGAFFFIADPWVDMRGGHSLLRDWRERRWKPTVALAAAGLLCGFFWEGCNFGAGAKWVYRIPYLDAAKIFEMPTAGYLGFPAFALELYALHQAARLIWLRLDRLSRAIIVSSLLLSWFRLFEMIDLWTVLR